MFNIKDAESAGTDDLVHENIQVLAQLIELIGSLSAEQYQRSLGQQGQHSVGKHVRHIVDHYQSFDHGLSDGESGACVDYENRMREPAVESDPGTACARLAEVSGWLQHLRCISGQQPLVLNYPTADRAVPIHSSVGRELIFLFSHTVHHMAIIGLLAEQLGVVPSSEFGVHPSTLRHWQREAARLARSG